MNETTTIQQLSNHLKRIEQEIGYIRQELRALPEYQERRPSIAPITSQYAFIDKTPLRKQMQQLLLTLAIQAKPVGAESLQKQMHEAELAANELSHSIISAREE